MGKLEVFGITFAENRRVFFPGNLISGRLMVQLKSPMDMKTMKVKFVGEAYVHWSESHSTGSGENRSTETRHHSARERFFEHNIYLMGEGSPDGGSSLPQGQRVYPFQFQLPAPLPTSYEDLIGYIRYYVKGTIVKPGKFDHNTKAAFTVLDTLDLNAMPNLLRPTGSSGSKTLCCWCCKSGPIEVEFLTDRSGYVPGEWIIVNATLSNGSNSRIIGTSLHLVQTVAHHATTQTKTISRNIASIGHPGCDGHKSVTWRNAKLRIPPLPPSESNHCRIIDIHYSVMFRAHLRKMAVDMRLHAPFIIGTIPLRSLPMYSNFPETMSAEPVMPSAPPAGPAITSEPTALPAAVSAPPPSYAAATVGGINIKDDNEYTMGETTYTPQYTFYDWNQSAFTHNE